MDKKLNYFSAVKFLSKYIRRYRKNFVMFYLGWLFDTLLAFTMPVVLGTMIDEIVYYQNLAVFLRISLLFVIMCIFSCILYFVIYAQHHYLMNMYTYNIKMDIFDHLQKCDAEYMNNISTGDVISIIQRYAPECMHFVVRNMIHIFNNLLIVIAITVYLFNISWQIGLFIIFAAPFSVFVNTKFGKKIRGYAESERKYYGTYISWLYEMLGGIRDIRLLGAQKKTASDFKDNNVNMFRVNIKSSVSTLTANNIIKFTGLCVQLLIFAFAGYLAVSGQITLGLLTIIVTFYATLTNKFDLLSRSYLDAQNRISYVQYIKDFLNSPTEEQWTGSNELKVEKGEIELKNIQFSYSNEKIILYDINLTVNPGECIAIVGQSGCGKTTLAYLMIGFYSLTRGEILIDGQRLCDCSLKSIRESIGIVSQDVLIFNGTVRENILLGNLQASDEAINTACRQAGIIDMIENLPEGLDTKIGINGIDLSGGQKQRIAIARIYLKNPPIIVFDEATSALDTKTENEIHNAWKQVLQNRTSIVISHRLSSVMICDRAAVMENGRITETGAPEELLEKSEGFKALFTSGGMADDK